MMSLAGTPILTTAVPAQISDAPSILVIGGLAGDRASSNTVMIGFEAYVNEVENFLDVTFIGAANPEGERLSFPPPDPAYTGHWTAWSLWHWIATHAPDAIIIMGDDPHGLGAALANGIAGLGSIPSFMLDYENELIEALRGRRQIPRSAARNTLNTRLQRSQAELAAGLATVYGQELPALTYIPGMALIGRLRLGQVAQVEVIVAPWLAQTDRPVLNNSL